MEKSRQDGGDSSDSKYLSYPELPVGVGLQANMGPGPVSPCSILILGYTELSNCYI